MPLDKVGEIEIVFTGLCGFLNLRNTNGTMPDPAVMLPRTSAMAAHIPFIGYDTREVSVDNPGTFLPVDLANDFYYRKLDGHRVVLFDDLIGWPTVTSSYDLIARKDDYWPEVKNSWDRNYVPLDGNPDPRFVAAYLDLGGGKVSAERMTDFPWEFRDETGKPSVRGYYAQEMVYRIFPYLYETDLTFTVILEPLSGAQAETFVFKPVRAGVPKIKLWIGNNDEKDMHRALLRVSSQPRKAEHFKFLNDVTSAGDGPIPSPLVPKRTFPGAASGSGTGSDTGYCGPFNADGG